MKLLFLGDVAIDSAYSLPDFHFPTQPDVILANLEGAIIAPELLRTRSARHKLALYNAPDVINLLQQFGVGAVCLANNHVYDFSLPIKPTVEALAVAGISSFGAGPTLEVVSKPLVLERVETTVKVFAFGWDIIGCRNASQNQEGVNPLLPDHVLQTVKNLRSQDKRSCVIFVFHWNYELELYPQPAHRQLAYELVDAGVDAVIGLHPHVAQGAEIYRGKPIFYSLGNWFFPERQIGSFKLSFPPASRRQLAIELTIDGRQINPEFHWYQFDQIKNTLIFESSETIEGPIAKSLTPFVDLTHDAYTRWFQKHRIRRRGLPIYYDYRHKKHNWFKDQQVKLRHGLITLLLRLGLKQSLQTNGPSTKN